MPDHLLTMLKSLPLEVQEIYFSITNGIMRDYPAGTIDNKNIILALQAIITATETANKEYDN